MRPTVLVNEVHTGGAGTLQHDAGDGDMGADGEVGSLAGGPEVADGGAAAPPVFGGGLVVADAVLGFAVEVAVVREPVLLAGLHPGTCQRVGVDQVGHPDRTVGAVARRGEAFVAFGADEVLLDLGVGPAL